MTTKHTPGPWIVFTHSDPELKMRTWIRRVPKRASTNDTVVAYIPDNPRAQYKKNAFLMAAAPEMLEALQVILDDTLENGETADAVHVRMLQEVIRKAKGEV